MKIKGSAVKAISLMVKKNYPDRYGEWLNSLPEESKKIFSEPILANEWYPLKDAASIPTKQIGKLFFNNDTKKGAWESGRFSAETALTGIYRVFIRAATPSYIINRASKIFVTYYSPTEMEVVDKHDKGVTLHINKFPEPDRVAENRIAGWIQRALEMNKCKNVKVRITKSLTMHNDYTEYAISWE